MSAAPEGRSHRLYSLIQDVETTVKEQEVITRLLRLGLERIPLETLLEQTLVQLLSLPWLSLLPRGGIFLRDETRDELVLAATHNQSASLESACARVPYGHCVCGRVAATGEALHVNCVNHLHDIRVPDMVPHGHIGVPIKFQGRLIGVLNLYLAEHQAISNENREFLLAVTDALAGIIVRRQAEMALAANEEAFRRILAGTAAETGNAFFQTLVRELAAVLKVRFAFVAELVDGGARARTLAMWADGYLADNIHYDLAGSPCERTFTEHLCFIREGVADRFPGNRDLAKMQVSGYAGVALHDTAGNIIGLIAILDDGPLSGEERIRMLLRIFGARAAAELERLQTEKLLDASQTRFRSLVETVNDWVWEVDENGVYTYASPRVRDLLGYEPGEIIGKTPFDLMPGPEAARVAAVFGRIAAAREPFSRLENLNLHRDGRAILLETSGMPVFDADGRFRGYRGVDRDITDKRRAEERFRSLVELAPDAIFIVDPSGRIVLLNRRAEQMFGYDRHELLGRDIELLVHEKHRSQHHEMRRAYLQAPDTRPMSERGYLYARHRDGSTLPVTITLGRLETESGFLVTSIVRDASDMVNIEKDLVSRAALTEHSPNPVIELDGHLNPRYLNAAASAAFPGLWDEGSTHPAIDGLRIHLPALNKAQQISRTIEYQGRVYQQHISRMPMFRTIRVHCWDITGARSFPAMKVLVNRNVPD